jgi:hypothetical protein
LVGAGAVDLALGHDEQFTGTESDGRGVVVVHRHRAFEHQKEIIGVVVFVKGKLALKFDHHHVVAIVAGDDMRVPMARKLR